MILKSYSKLVRSKWYTIAFTYDSGYLLLYVNGVLDTAMDINPYYLYTNTHSLMFGLSTTSYTECVYALRYFEIYDVQLTSPEIEAKSSRSFY